jgi:hypothetical protein
MRFFTGLHQPSDAFAFDAAFISVNRLRSRKTMRPNDWIMDSGAFTTIGRHAGYPEEPEIYAAEIRRWAGVGNLLAAVSQDYMCEPVMLAKTGLSVSDHQGRTIERYDRLLALDRSGVYLMPVLQGFEPREYVQHLEQFDSRLGPGAWVGVGSVCKRNGDPQAIEAVLAAVHRARPDLNLHGFGLKSTALSSGLVRELLFSADSMAWSLAARKQGRNRNDRNEAIAFRDRIRRRPWQRQFLL